MSRKHRVISVIRDDGRINITGYRTWRRVTGHKRPTIAFYPDKPRPWYFIWPVTHVSGAKLIDDVATADIVMQFDDSTETDNTVPMVRDGAKLVNFTCDDICTI